jgi:phosphoserine phosphatase
MQIIRPGKEVAEKVAARYIETIVPGAAAMIRAFKSDGWLPVILSGGFAPLIAPLAEVLEIDHVEAVPLFFSADGSYAGYGHDYPTTRNLGKNEVIREWKAAMLPECVVMVGDGVSDLETKPEVDMFIGFGGVAARPLVKQGADKWIMHLDELVAGRHNLGRGDQSVGKIH